MQDSQRVFVVADVRHTRPDETIQCAAAWKHGDRWAQYFVTAKVPPEVLGKADVQWYLCKPCLGDFVKLADGLATG